MLVDDQHLLRMGFKLILEGEDDLEVIAEAADGAEALATLESLGEDRPDVVLMDVRMPRMDGIEATGKIVERWCDTKVIILTTFDLDEYAFSGLQAGASAFLLKDVEPADLVSAVRVVASGDAVVAPRITQRLLEMYVRRPEGAGEAFGAAQQAHSPAQRGHVETPGLAAGQVPSAQGPAAPLTPTGAEIAAALNDGVPREPLTQRETEVLFAVAEGLSNAEIAAKFFLSEATVKTHVRRILTKLQLRDRVQAVVYVYQAGLVG
ncbi:response regulator transcription factor [Nesterenkonia flava]|uniref:Response regulator transcription factor n=1 Tax=Nesterenkonia flava TaxID=469799 RepID=A0ABU1FSY9_9MICC|nr:response regulator transcription factor [Nesterenkonia flava]MDR5711777.1 response regulator transcription factor [Nesterenkonia flava]